MSLVGWYENYIKESKKSYHYFSAGITIDFAVEIAKEIKKQKLTITEIAKRMNVCTKKVSKILNGYTKMTVDDMTNICFALGISCSVIINWRSFA